MRKKKYVYVFESFFFSVAEMKKKSVKNEKKREKCSRNLAGLLPIFSLGTGSRYNHLYHDTEARRLVWPGGKAMSLYKLCIMAGAVVVSQ